MTGETHLIQQLIAAHHSGRADVDAAPYSRLDRAAAYRIQHGVRTGLAAGIGLLKTAVHPDGVGVVAPIRSERFGQSGSYSLPLSRVIGLELEVGLVLARDLDSTTASADESEIIEAIDHYFVGIEVCGSRFRNRAEAGPIGGLADSMSAFGYVIDPTPREPGADIEAYDAHLLLNGTPLHAGKARHSFGTVLSSFVAYARNQHPDYPLRAGTIVTTGSLCGLVPVSSPGHVVGRLGSHTVEFDLT